MFDPAGSAAAPPVVRLASVVGHGDDEHFIRLDPVDQIVRKPPDGELPIARSEGRTLVRILGETFERPSDGIREASPQPAASTLEK
jgi:hypothetical protein